MTLRDYQEKAVLEASTMLANGKRKIIFQLPTGAGKTVCFSAISQRFISKSDKSVLILVHRKELLQQTRRTLFNAFNITAQPIVAGMRSIPHSRVYVGMIESAVRRIPKDIGLLIVDEAHLANFFKIHDYFSTQFVIGFTATPLSANKSKPLKNYYEDIVTTVQIRELIASGSLAQNITFAPRDIVDRSELRVKGGEFDEHAMAMSFSKPKYVQNTVQAYLKYAKETRAIVFNCNINHSKQVNAAFLSLGLPSRHLDGTMTDTERRNILSWFENTPSAILNNVAIATTGTDIPSIETVIVNKSTMSMPLFGQMCGRGGRPTDFKSAFTIIDLGGNAMTHGDWDDDRDWNDLFHNPAKKSKGQGVAPVKNCPSCDAILPASQRTCKHCGFEFPISIPAIEQQLSDFIIITKGIDVRAVIERHRERKDYYPFFKIGKDIAQQARNTVPKMSDEAAAFILSQYNEKAKEWCHVKGKKFNQWHQNTARDHLYAELSRHYVGWENPFATAAQPLPF